MNNAVEGATAGSHPLEPAAARRRVHLPYLDAIRGLAALIVVLHHAYGLAIGDRIWDFPAAFHRPYHLMLYAHYAVNIFIVLSGYCLMLPVVLSGDGKLAGGVGEFMRRRARRILPPYYIAYALSVALVLGVRWLQSRGVGTGEKVDVVTPGGVLTHLLVIHNWFPTWAGEANAALWSVATEWHIYFFFPLLLLPLWRRFGVLAALAGSIALGVAPLVAYPPLRHAVEQACPWYLVLFALGMSAAALNYSERPWAVRARAVIPWRFLPVFLAVAAGVLLKLLSGSRNHLLVDPIFGLLVAFAIAYCTWEVQSRESARGQAPTSAGVARPRLMPVTRILDARPLVWMGTFSYSVYLVHMPLLMAMRALVPPSQFPPTVQFLVVIPLEILLAYALSYAFFTAFERPFLRRPQSRAAAARPGRSAVSAPEVAAS